MRHVNALNKGHFQMLVPKGTGSVYSMHIDPAGVVCQLFKFQEFQLDFKWSILHFKGSDDLLVRNEVMDRSTKNMLVASGIGSFKQVRTVPPVLHFLHF